MEQRHGILPDDHWWVQGRLQVLSRLVTRNVAAATGSQRSGAALDAGAGSGLWARRLARWFDRVVLAEPDPALCARLASEFPRDRVVEASLPALPLPDHDFDFISCLDVLEHIDDDFRAARELHRLLHPAGTLLITVPAYPHLWSSHDLNAGHRRRYTRDSLVRLLVSAGFRVELLSPLNVWLYPAAWAARRLGRPGTKMPGPLLNRLLAEVYGSEGRLVGHWPLPLPGLSLIALARPNSL